jgi:hypothetical protein
MNCPRCHSVNPDSALRCDCGYDLSSGEMKASHLPTEISLMQAKAPGASSGKTYLLLLYGGFLLGMAGLAMVPVCRRQGGGATIAWVAVTFGALAFEVAAIWALVLLYQVWRYVIVESRRHGLVPPIDSPGKAVGYLFIPVFNIYWAFIAYGKLAPAWNALAAATGRRGGMSRWLGITLSILPWLALIPRLGGSVFLLDVLALFPLFVIQAVERCRRPGLEAAREEALPIQTFLCLFDVRHHGFNFYLAAGLFLGSSLPFLIDYRIWEGLLKDAYGSYHPPGYSEFLLMAALSAIFSALLFVVLLHVTPRDWLLPLLWGAGAVGLRWIQEGIPQLLLSEDAMPSVTFGAQAIYTAVGSAAFLLALILAVRWLGAGLRSFLLAQLALVVVSRGFDLARSLAQHRLQDFDTDPMSLIMSLIGATLSAVMFFGALSYHLEERGFRLHGKKMVRTVA